MCFVVHASAIRGENSGSWFLGSIMLLISLGISDHVCDWVRRHIRIIFEDYKCFKSKNLVPWGKHLNSAMMCRVGKNDDFLGVWWLFKVFWVPNMLY